MSKVTREVSLVLLVCALFCLNSPLYSAQRGVRNNGFQQRGFGPGKFLDNLCAHIEKLRKDGWTCPDAKDWPRWWSARGKNVRFEISERGGKTNDRYAKITGQEGYLVGYGGQLKDCNYLLCFWVRGKGKARVGFWGYTRDRLGRPRGTKPPKAFTVSVDSEKWVRYQHILQKTPELSSVHVTAGVLEGTIDFDEVSLLPAEIGRQQVVLEEEKLYGTGALIENMDFVQADESFARWRDKYQAAIKEFRARTTGLDEKLVASLEHEIAKLHPYVLTQGLKTLQVPYYNEMIVATGLLNRLAGKDPASANSEKAPPVKAAKSVTGYKPGFRAARPGAVTITEIKPNRILYKENEPASIKATLVNNTPAAQKGTLIAIMHLDLDTTREIGRKEVILPKGKKKTWGFAYNVGPETFGRGIEIRFVDEAGRIVDSWQEFYHVAREYFRVFMMGPLWAYGNYSHFHSGEPTSLGVHSTDAEIYISSQTAYRVNRIARAKRIAHLHKRGINFNFYQNNVFNGQMGWEVVRKHPDFVLYGENGQYALDPIYVAYPNPIEIASPIEIGPKRKVKKAYLDRIYNPRQFGLLNVANEDAMTYVAKCIKKYAEENNIDGVYFDGVPTVQKGYDVHGKPNIPDDREKIASINGRMQHIYQKIVREEDPYFGTWFNFSRHGIEYRRHRGRVEGLLGCGVGDDVSDEWIRALTGWKNVMCLYEFAGPSLYCPGDGFSKFPDKLLQTLIDNRDYITQKYDANTVIGFISVPWDQKNPGPSKWAWPTINYLKSIFTATQYHNIIFGSMPSHRPFAQFNTRHSRFIWARDIKTVVPAEVEKIMDVRSPEKIWWKRFVYKRKTTDGYDLIVHLVRIPPTEKWDINWADEPVPLEGVKITVNAGSGKIYDVQSMRPYYFEEEQQPVQKVLEVNAEDGKATVALPDFRYHMMVVFRVKTKLSAATRTNNLGERQCVNIQE